MTNCFFFFPAVGRWSWPLCVGVCLMKLFTCSVAMPPPGPQTATNDIANFMNSLQGFVGEVSGIIVHQENHEAFSHLSMTGSAYLDSLNTLNIHLLMYVSHEEAVLLMNIQQALSNMVSVLEELATCRMRFEDLEGCNQDDHEEVETMTVRPVGRQRILIQRDQIEVLRSIGYSWTRIADTLGISARTLRNRRHEFGMAVGDATYDDLNDGQIDEIVTSILRVTPRAGQSMIAGAVRQRGIVLQRHRIRDSIHRVNPVATALRRRYHITRRRYNVGQPNALW